MKQKVRWHRTKTLGGTGLVTRFYMAGTETLCGGSPAQRCVVSGYPTTGKVFKYLANAIGFVGTLELGRGGCEE